MSPVELRASASLASLFALRMLGLFLILPVFAVHAGDLQGGQNATLVGLALGIYGLTQALLQIPFGAASDRLGRKPVIVAGLLLFALGSFVAAWGEDIVTVIVGRAIQGAGAISAAVTAFIADSTRDSQRTKAMAMVGASIGLTFALSLVAAPALYGLIGVDGIFALTGALGLAGILVVLFVVPASARSEVQTVAPATQARQVLTDPDLLRLNLGIFVLHAVQMAMFVIVPQWLAVGAGLPVAEHWKVYLPVVLLSFAIMLPPLMAAERRGRLRQLFVAAIALLAIVAGLLSTQPPGLVPLAGLLLAFFVAFNILEASLPSLVSRLAPPAAKGLALGVYNTTQALGLFAGGLVGGAVQQGFGAPAVFVVCTAMLLIWLVLAPGLRRWPQRRV